MEIRLYRSLADKKKLDKTSQLTLIGTKQANLKADTSTQNPHFLIAKFHAYEQVNYLYVPYFDRYYFVNNQTLLKGGIVDFDCKSDVLMSRKNQLLNLTALVRRQENKKNSFLIDNELITQSNTNFFCKTVGTSVLSDYNIYITTCGGGV